MHRAAVSRIRRVPLLVSSICHSLVGVRAGDFAHLAVKDYDDDDGAGSESLLVAATV